MKKYRSRFLLFLLFFASSCSLFSVSLYDAYYTYRDPVSAVGASLTAAYLNVPQLTIPGVSISGGSGLVPKAVTFTNSDVSKYKDALINPQSSNAILKFLSMAVSALSPLVSNAVAILDQIAVSNGDFIVNGTINITGGDTISLSEIVAMQLVSPIDIVLDCNIQLSGKSFLNGVIFVGKVNLKSDEMGTLTVHPVDFTINGELVEDGYIRFKGLLSQEV